MKRFGYRGPLGLSRISFRMGKINRIGMSSLAYSRLGITLHKMNDTSVRMIYSCLATEVDNINSIALDKATKRTSVSGKNVNKIGAYGLGINH